MLWRDLHAGGFLHHAHAQPYVIHRTISDQTGNSFILYLWRAFKTGLSMCPDLCRKHSLVNCTLIATVTGTNIATIQLSASTQNPSCESLERVLYGCPVVYAALPTSRGIVDIIVLRLPQIKRTRVLRSSSESPSIMHDASGVRVKWAQSVSSTDEETVPSGIFADWLATSDGPLRLGSTVHELARVGYVSSTATISMFFNLRLSV